jgi:putative ABC transport system substrate-binding protein
MVAEFAEGDPAKLEPLLGELLRAGINVLVAVAASTRMVPIAQKSVPVVFSFSGDPVAAGYVKSLANPGGNATGNSQLMWELVGKRLELLREIAPSARRLLVVQSPDHPGETEERTRSLNIGTRLGFEMQIRPVRDRDMLRAALAEGEALQCDSMLCFTDAVTVPNRQIIADHAKRLRIPSVFPRREFTEAGGIASYGPSIPDLTQRLAGFVVRIANGTRAGDIPVEWPTVIEIVINLRVAQEIGVAVPQVVMLRADEVIE